MNETILITGGCGFVGTNIALNLKMDYPESRILVLDNLKRRGSELNISRLLDAGVEFFHGDIRNKEDFDQIGEISILIEAAAEPSVLSGINSTPDYVINTNLSGTINCLGYASKYKAKFIFLSTSRVYPISNLSKINYTKGETRFLVNDEQTLSGISKHGIAENFPMDGARSFYGASKYASELFIQEFSEFYGLKSIINRCGVLTGPWQMGKIDQGVVVLWLAKHFWNKELSYIGFGGQGLQLRDILHINDLYALVKMQLRDFSKFEGQIFNVGGGNDVSVSLLELTALCEDITGNRITIHRVEENRAADIPIYITDNSKIQSICDWKPESSSRTILIDIFDWIKKNENSVKKLLS
jgi:CDP-paratose 2-epimerase